MAGPTWLTVLPIGMAAALFWSLVGWPFARRCLPAGLPAAAVCPLLGWCIHTALAATVLRFTGFGFGAVAGTGVLVLLVAWAMHLSAKPPSAEPMPGWLPLLCGVIACLPAAAILPSQGAGGVRLAAPIFDHSKIAMVDAMLRLGVPPVNPFYGAPGVPAHLAYYWWWHASAAEIGRMVGVTGWTADAALTWFTAYATLMLMGGLGLAMGGRVVAGLSVGLALPGSIRPLTDGFGWLHRATGLGGWLDQASWAPQHVAAAGALVVAVLLLARGPSLAGLVALGCTVAAGFGASAWVGGIVGAVALPAAAWFVAPRGRGGLVWAALGWAGGAALLTLVLIAPLLRDQLAAARGGHLLAVAVYPSFTDAGALLNLAGFPLTLLVEFPALVLLGGFGLRSGRPGWQTGLIAAGLAGLAVCLVLRSTIENNDLGWRAVMPFVLVATPFAAAGAVRLWRRGLGALVYAVLAGGLGLMGTWAMLGTARGAPDAGFVQAAAVWREVRRLTGPADRVASDPRDAAAMTPWPANIGWALLADRSSCYSGWATAHPFAWVPAMALYATDVELRRVFDGAPAPGDLGDLAGRLHCAAALVTPGSEAWAHDPFAHDPGWRLLGSGAGWRLYGVR
jgi:hypothetical protein